MILWLQFKWNLYFKIFLNWLDYTNLTGKNIMFKQKRHRFTSEQKAHAVLRYLQDQESVSSICESLSIYPSQFCQWQKEAMSNLSNAFVKDNSC